jgi:methylamine dehydrogenase heavy chain
MQPLSPRLILLGALLGVALVAAGRAGGADPQKTAPVVVRLPEQPGPHWFWLSDVMLHRTALFDGDSGELLGTITSGSPGVGFVIYPLFSPDHREIYLAESYFSRGVRGERTDVVTVYDAQTLAPGAEIAIPPHRGEYFPGAGSNALSDDGRYMAIFNLTPATSITIVDVKQRQLVSEVATPGCGLVFAAGPRRFLMVCANGAALTVTLDEQGGEPTLERSEPFFDPQKDPVTEKAVRAKNEWFFVSYEGILHPVDVSGDKPRFGEPWPLFNDEDRRASWRIGGAQHLAVHTASGRLYALVHQGGPDTHKDAGTEVWVYDIANHRRVERIPMLNPLVSFIGLEGGLDPKRTSGNLLRWALGRILPNPGVDRILVTQDDRPLLVASASMPPAVTLHDASSGTVVREVSEPGLGSSLLFAP